MGANPLDGLTRGQREDLMEVLVDNGYRDVADRLYEAFPPPRDNGWYEVWLEDGRRMALWWNGNSWHYSLNRGLDPVTIVGVDETQPIIHLVPES
jgi:hypothetical protein